MPSSSVGVSSGVASNDFSWILSQTTWAVNDWMSSTNSRYYNGISNLAVFLFRGLPVWRFLDITSLTISGGNGWEWLGLDFIDGLTDEQIIE